jgi:PPM family protein phosphatase
MFEKSSQEQINTRETREIKPEYVELKVSASLQTDVGCIREANEDFGRHIVPNDWETKLRRGSLTIVADGMGGHASGEVASQMAVELIGRYYYEDMENSAPFALQKAVELANAEIYQTSVSDENLFGMGTTLVILVLLDNKAFSAHVGDSRLYRLRRHHLELLTFDHSQVMEMVKQGLLSFEDAWNHEDKNIILRAVGTQPTVEVEVSDIFEIAAGDELMLCSDGLSDMLPDNEIREIWSSSKDVHETCENLIESAKRRGGHDNVTVGVIGISAENETVKTRAVPQTREMERLEI